MTLPSRIAGDVTQEVGYVEIDSNAFAIWLRDGLGSLWKIRPVSWPTIADAAMDLSPSAPLSRYAAIPAGSWTLILNNGPRGTDVGLLPSHAARELGCRGVRAVCVEDHEPGYPARILEVFGPDGAPPLLAIRTIAVANDGGRWVFETRGTPFSFERLNDYTCRRVTDRFTPEALYAYLRELLVPIDMEPDWASALLVEWTN